MENLILFYINGTLSPSGTEAVGVILSIGIVVALIGWTTGKFWFMPYLEYRQKMLAKQNTMKPTGDKIRKA